MKPALLLLLAMSVPLLAPESANAQGFAPGLPLSLKTGGWARYRKEGADGPSTVVVRVGAKEKRKGRAGTWVAMEIDIPDAGRISIELLVAGARLEMKNVLALRAGFPNQKPQEQPPAADGEEAAVAEPKLVSQKQQKVSGKTIEVKTFDLGSGVLADWSEAVPGFGMVHMGGAEPVTLEDFGVGGDPWRGIPATAPELIQEPPAKKASPRPPPDDEP
ncbi:MAG: hypothetical protein HY901_16305 [Deltaproteobacteria bacterium]|nr:hypothetical protein [Deltaproteobacteria bacterium]